LRSPANLAQAALISRSSTSSRAVAEAPAVLTIAASAAFASAAAAALIAASVTAASVTAASVTAASAMTDTSTGFAAHEREHAAVTTNASACV
jgi:hypothetical protein